MGRKRTYDREALVPVICQRLADGIPLAEICRETGMPTAWAVWDWQQEDKKIDNMITRARAAGYDLRAARMLRTARGFGPELGGDSTGDVKRDRLIVDTDLKLLARWDPKRYGEGLQLRHADADGQKIEQGPRFAEALALLRMAQGVAPPAEELTVIGVETLPPEDDFSDLV